MGLSIHRAHLRRNLAPMIPPSTTQGSDYPHVPRLGNQAIRLQEAAQGRVIEPRPIVIQPETCLLPLPREAAILEVKVRSS